MVDRAGAWLGEAGPQPGEIVLEQADAVGQAQMPGCDQPRFDDSDLLAEPRGLLFRVHAARKLSRSGAGGGPTTASTASAIANSLASSKPGQTSCMPTGSGAP